jgi:type I restriction enzyme, S subunit
MQTVPLCELGEIVSGSTPKTGVPQFWDGDIPWITPADLSNHEGIYFHGTPKRISKAGFDSCSTAMLPAGSILFSSRAPIGHCALTAYPACTNQGFKNIVPNKRLDPVYGYFALKFLTPAIVAMGRGATFAEINKELFESVQVPYCDLPEQRRIAGQLEQADRLVRTRRYALELTDTFLPAAFLELFGETGDRFPASTVDELAADKPNAIRTGPFGSQLLHSEFTDRGIAVLGIDNAVNNEFAWDQRRFITPEKYQQLKRYTVFPGDVIITIMGTCGRCAIVPDDLPTAINTKHLCCITLDQNRCLPIYLHGAFLFHPFVSRQRGVAMKGAIMDGLNMEIIKGLRIPLPPLPLQQRFAALMEQVKRLRAVQREALRQAEHLFASLLHNAFSG